MRRKKKTTPREDGLAAAHESLVKYAAMYQGAYGSIHSIKFYGNGTAIRKFTWKYGMLADIIAGDAPVASLKASWNIFEDMNGIRNLHAHGKKDVSAFLRSKNVIPHTGKYYLYRGRLDYAKNVLSIGADFEDDEDDDDNDEGFIEDIINDGYYDCFEFLVDYGEWVDYAIISSDCIKKLCMAGIIVLYRDDDVMNMSLGDVRASVRRRRGIDCRVCRGGARGNTDVMIATAE